MTSLAARRRVWAITLMRLLPEAARGQRHERAILRDVAAMLAELLPRLSLGRAGEEDVLRGTLGAASTALELGRFNRLRRDPDLPPAAGAIIAGFLDRFAAALESLPDAGRSLSVRVADAERVTA